MWLLDHSDNSYVNSDHLLDISLSSCVNDAGETLYYVRGLVAGTHMPDYRVSIFFLDKMDAFKELHRLGARLNRKSGG